MNNRQTKADFLLDELGAIDERAVTEALRYRPRRIAVRRIFAVAACIMLAAALITAQVALRRSDGERLYGTLSSADGCYVSDESSGYRQPALVWRVKGESGYFVKPIAASDANKIASLAGDGSEIEGEANGDIDGLWLVCENGFVISPYLKKSAGNVGYGTLFDYSPEIEPSKRVYALITEIITE